MFKCCYLSVFHIHLSLANRVMKSEWSWMVLNENSEWFWMVLNGVFQNNYEVSSILEFISNQETSDIIRLCRLKKELTSTWSKKLNFSAFWMVLNGPKWSSWNFIELFHAHNLICIHRIIRLLLMFFSDSWTFITHSIL